MAMYMSGEESFQKRLNSKTEDLPGGATYLIGVAIFKKSTKSDGTSEWNLLVVKRAEHEDSFPNNWELPGGHIEAGETVSQAVDRETIEETGLVVDKVLGDFAELYWTSRSSGRRNVQFNYAVTVKQPMEIRLNPEEHSDWKWTDDEEVTTLLCTEAMMKVLTDSFKFANEHLKEKL